MGVLSRLCDCMAAESCLDLPFHYIKASIYTALHCIKKKGEKDQCSDRSVSWTNPSGVHAAASRNVRREEHSALHNESSESLFSIVTISGSKQVVWKLPSTSDPLACLYLGPAWAIMKINVCRTVRCWIIRLENVLKDNLCITRAHICIGRSPLTTGVLLGPMVLKWLYC